MIAIVITIVVCVGSLGLLLFLDREGETKSSPPTERMTSSPPEVRGRGGDE